ncbi:hypothetical protein D3Y57_02490 (plasmid) [Sphingomonas paeninsulae]|uniref:Uncharacterized protein n=1 Tax=Sphingomonas paeninsulae TaxID=2319844 RepID=A0A494TGG7_SPHPE|nr:hypothetical protein D3Y57_02490 [Sphingomonas paeninsulae]
MTLCARLIFSFFVSLFNRTPQAIGYAFIAIEPIRCLALPDGIDGSVQRDLLFSVALNCPAKQDAQSK